MRNSKRDFKSLCKEIEFKKGELLGPRYSNSAPKDKNISRPSERLRKSLAFYENNDNKTSNKKLDNKESFNTKSTNFTQKPLVSNTKNNVLDFLSFNSNIRKANYGSGISSIDPKKSEKKITSIFDREPIENLDNSTSRNYFTQPSNHLFSSEKKDSKMHSPKKGLFSNLNFEKSDISKTRHQREYSREE